MILTTVDSVSAGITSFLKIKTIDPGIGSKDMRKHSSVLG
jgi:hypothetical protein